MKARRVLRRILLGVVVLLAALFVVANVALGPIVKQAVEAAGPVVLGVPVTVQKVRIFPLMGTARIDGLVLGAPKGYSANLAELEHFRAKVQLFSLLTDTIVVREIVIRGPEVTYELAGLKSNLGTLLDELGSEEAPPRTEGPKADQASKKVIIEHFLFEQGKVRLATTLTGGRGVVLPLPRIEMRDIGKEKQGVSMLAAVRATSLAVSVAVLTTVRDGVAGVAGLGTDAIAAIAGSAGAGLQSASKLAGKALAIVGQGAAAAGAAAFEGAKALGDLAAQGAAAVGGNMAEGAKAVGGLAVKGAATVGEGVAHGASKVGSLATEGASAVGGAVVGGVRTVGNVAAEGAKTVGGAMVGGVRTAGTVATEGVKAVGGVAAEGVKAVGGVASEGVKAVGGALRSVGGLFSGKTEDEGKAKAPEEGKKP